MTRKLTVTGWYPPEIKPVRVGVYEVDEGDSIFFSFWNGERFGWRSSSHPNVAFIQRDTPTTLSCFATWRGLARKPK